MSTPSHPSNLNQPPHNAYTDAPTLHPQLFLGSLQLLGWLFFHPRAWRNHIARIEPTLRPDFALIELSRTQWQNPALRRLIFQSCVVWNTLFTVLIIVMMLLVGVAADGIAYNAMMVLIACLTLSTIVGPGLVAGGIVGGTFAYVVGSLWPGELMWNVGAVALGIMGSLMISLVGRGRTYSLTRQISGIVISLTLGLFLSASIFGLFFLASSTPVKLVPILIGALLIILGFILVCQWRANNWRYGLALGLFFSIAFSLGGYLTLNLTDDILEGLMGGALEGATVAIWLGIIFLLAYMFAEQMGGARAGAIAGTVCFGGIYLLIRIASVGDSLTGSDLVVSVLSFLGGLTLNWWRPVLLYPFLLVWNFLLYRFDEQRLTEPVHALRYHSAFWDEAQRLRWPFLTEHLVGVLDQNPVEGAAALEYLVTSHQRRVAQSAQIELEARGLERCTDLVAISRAHHALAAGELVGPASALLRSLSRLSQDTEAALFQESTYNQRLALCAVEDRLDGLLRELTRSSERYATRFRPIIMQWRHIVMNNVRTLTEAAEQRQEIDSPYIVGVPLTAQQEIFVGRTEISARIEELLLDQRRPPILLYGQRRMGKTSLLINLGRLLPERIVPLFVDLQGPVTQAADHGGLLYNLSRSLISSAQRQRNLEFPPLARQALALDPFTSFDEWLDIVEQVLGERTALLTLDEFEALDGALVEGRFSDKAVLGMLRHIIQHRPKFKVLIAGSHTLEEMKSWSSYLVNVQVVHLSYLNPTEAYHLIERPVKDFALQYEPEASRRVLELTQGHPTLVQLLCAEIVALKNRQPVAVRRLAHSSDVEAAVPEAIQQGSFFFMDIEHNQVDPLGQTVLHFLAQQGERAMVSHEILMHQFPNQLTQSLALLLRRELLERTPTGYAFQVEMVRRWFARPSPLA